jgi:hypothetical protein
MHNKELVPEDHPDGEGDDPDTDINQKISEQIRHSTSQ